MVGHRISFGRWARHGLRYEFRYEAAGAVAVMAGTGKSGAGRPRLLLLDGHSMAYRAFYAFPAENFATSTG